jgi:uncharacterized repeat protein (TIGR01451 family)
LTIHVQATTNAGSCGTLVNDPGASVTLGTEDPIISNIASVTVQCPTLTLNKTPESQTVDAGQGITFTVTVTNSGTGNATDVDITDPLPGGSGIDWTINPANASCSITGSPPNETLSCLDLTINAGQNFSVTVTSPTTTASCGIYDNTASFTSGNDGSGNDTESVTVRCAPGIVTQASGSATPLSTGDTTTDLATFTPQGNLGSVTGRWTFPLRAWDGKRGHRRRM